MGLKILQSQRVPRYTITGDGLPSDSSNVDRKQCRSQRAPQEKEEAGPGGTLD
jgi:hypothetical protein